MVLQKPIPPYPTIRDACCRISIPPLPIGPPIEKLPFVLHPRRESNLSIPAEQFVHDVAFVREVLGGDLVEGGFGDSDYYTLGLLQRLWGGLDHSGHVFELSLLVELLLDRVEVQLACGLFVVLFLYGYAVSHCSYIELI
jgi:hypothetical protein